MTYNYSKAYSVAIWFRKEPFFKENSHHSWYVSSLEPSWFSYIPAPHELKSGDIILINRKTRLDFAGRILIKGNDYTLVNYHGEDVKITIKKVGILREIKNRWITRKIKPIIRKG